MPNIYWIPLSMSECRKVWGLSYIIVGVYITVHVL